MAADIPLPPGARQGKQSGFLATAFGNPEIISGKVEKRRVQVWQVSHSQQSPLGRRRRPVSNVRLPQS
ncbi:MAG TPA: hypothetical protein VFY63_15810 [Pseudorhizobium sp.]|nr:hypothetical protein [Pseudorhizobium sp.]